MSEFKVGDRPPRILAREVEDMNTPRRYPRTLAEAFGPHTSSHISEETASSHAARWIFAALAVVAGLLAFAHWGLN